jgi:hypothetical protein
MLLVEKLERTPAGGHPPKGKGDNQGEDQPGGPSDGGS